MTVEAGTRSPEMTVAQTAYKKAFYDRFALMGLTPEYASLEINKMGEQGFVPTVEFTVRADSLPPSLQTLVGETFQGFFSNLRVVMGLHQTTLIAINSDGAEVRGYPLSFGEGVGQLVQTGHEIAFDVDGAKYGVSRATFRKTGPSCEAPQLVKQQIQWRGLEPKVIDDFAGLIGWDSDGTKSKVAIYHRQHPDLPSSFRNGSPSFSPHGRQRHYAMPPPF